MKSKIDKFLATFTPREELILRLKFGITSKRFTDKEIVDEISRYTKSFTMAQLKRHYKVMALMVLDKNRKDYKVIFNFAAGEIVFLDKEMEKDYSVTVALQELENSFKSIKGTF